MVIHRRSSTNTTTSVHYLEHKPSSHALPISCSGFGTLDNAGSDKSSLRDPVALQPEHCQIRAIPEHVEKKPSLRHEYFGQTVTNMEKAEFGCRGFWHSLGYLSSGLYYLVEFTSGSRLTIFRELIPGKLYRKNWIEITGQEHFSG